MGVAQGRARGGVHPELMILSTDGISGQLSRVQFVATRNIMPDASNRWWDRA